MKNLLGNFSLGLLGIALVMIVALSSDTVPPRMQSQIASVAPSASEEIWQIGNKPIGYLEEGQSQRSTGQLWDLDSSYQNIQFSNVGNNSYGGQNDVWQTLNSQVQSSENQVSNNPLEGQSTFGAPAPLSSFEAYDSFNNQSESQGSWWSNTWSSVGNWGSGAVNTVEGWFGISNQPDNPCPGGVCEAMGIRG